jgi:GNAT superfamily N-acetyltransferase
MISFMLLSECAEGSLADILVECYRPLLSTVPAETARKLCQSWQEYDRSVHEERDTVGRCGFMTITENHLVGFASWDPRNWPDVGRIGHHCVRPQYQGRGYGRRQVAEILERLRTLGFAKVQARTDEHPFFEPARRVYVKCGFVVVERKTGMLTPDYRMIVYEIAFRENALRRTASAATTVQ